MKLLLRVTITCCISFTAILNLHAQTLDWWSNTVHWDGVTSWKRYLIYTPGYMGPNALPVPELSNGNIDSTTWLGASGAFHFSNGDNTQNIKLNTNILVAKNKVSLDFTYIPKEWFQEDHATKTERHVYYPYYYTKSVPGDAYMNVNMLLMNKWRPNIQLALRLGYRFPTSSAYGPARYTDAPAYYFDLSFSKPQSPRLNLVGMAGFLAWQTNSDVEFQNDALVVGGGIDYNYKNFRARLQAVTYYGYFREKDDPLVMRLYFDKKIGRMNAMLHFQQGLHDFDYFTVETGLNYQLKK